MKKQIIRAGICIGKIFLNLIYFFIKLLPSKNKIVMLSRQSNSPSLDFQLIEREILKRNDKIEIEILCKKLKKDYFSRFKYCFYILKCMKQIATAKVCILDGYSIPISLLKHKKHLEIIQIWHASGAIKKFGYQSLNKKEGRGKEIAKLMDMHKNYKHVMAPTKATAEFYKKAFNVKEDQIFINGLPRIDYILETNKLNKKQKEFYKDYPQYKNKRTILYVPTFRKNEDYSKYLKQLIKNVNRDKYNLIIKTHPLDKKNKFNKYEINKKYNTFDLIVIADYIITDYSAVAFEASILNKPIYFYVFDIERYKSERGLNIDLLEEMKSCTYKSAREIINSIEEDNYNYDELLKFKNKYMGNPRNNNTKKLVDFIFNYLDEDVRNEKN